MRIEQLEFLMDLQQTGSLSKTAQNFMTSHQVVSSAIKSLETELGTILLTRSFNGVIFTEAGRIVLAFAAIVLSARVDMYNQLTPYQLTEQPKYKGVINVYAIPRLMNDWFLDFFNRFRRDNPGTKIYLRNERFDKIIEEVDFDAQTIAIATVAEETLYAEVFAEQLKARQLQYKVLSVQSLLACASAKSKWARLENIAMEELNQIPKVVFKYSAYLPPEALNQQTCFKELYSIDNFEAQKKLIKMGYGVGMYTPQEYQYFFKDDRNFILLPLAEDAKSLFYYIALIQNSQQLTPQVLYFTEQLERWLN